MTAERLTLALEQLKSSDWRTFELFAAEYIAVQYPSLRTMAASHGDKGRDGEIYVPDEQETVAVQYSVTADWNEKIKATIARLSGTFPAVKVLMYATNQSIGPKADALKESLRINDGIFLDVLDNSWFIEREFTHAQREVAADRLCKRFVDPLLSARGLKTRVAPGLDGKDSRIALLHISMQAEDKAQGKGLTKGVFESLVLAALHDTSVTNRLKFSEIEKRVRRFLPAEHENRAQVRGLISGALARLAPNKGGRVHHHKSTDDYGLSNEEHVATLERSASYLADQATLEAELSESLKVASLEAADDVRASIASHMRVSIEKLLLERGEAFASAIKTGEIQQLNPAEVLSTSIAKSRSALARVTIAQATAVMYDVLDQPSTSTRRHLRRLADAYTMFAFLRQTPDVQRVVIRLFSDGRIWLDTSIVLPLVAETLLSDPAQRHFTTLLQAARDAGIELFVTAGVIEETERHINRSIAFARTSPSEWRTRVPFLYSIYASSGGERAKFVSWAQVFAGRQRPLQDIQDYLNEFHHIEQRDLSDTLAEADEELKNLVQDAWYEAHEKRRQPGDDDSEFSMLRLVRHDVENFLGVIMSRKLRSTSPLGYREWFLTLDGTAFKLGRLMKEGLGVHAPASPVLSPDFLTEFLRLGPMRSAIEANRSATLPLITDISKYENTPIQLIEQADTLRERFADLDEHVVRRNVRDEMDRARLRMGQVAHGGLPGVEKRLTKALDDAKRKQKRQPMWRRRNSRSPR